MSNKLVCIKITAELKTVDGERKYVSNFEQAEADILKNTDRTLKIMASGNRWVFDSRTVINKTELNQIVKSSFYVLSLRMWFIKGEKDIEEAKKLLRQEYEKEVLKEYNKILSIKETFENGDWTGDDSVE